MTYEYVITQGEGRLIDQGTIYSFLPDGFEYLVQSQNDRKNRALMI